MADFWQKKSYSQEDIESTKKLLELLRPMEEEKINSDENGFATIHTYALENNLDLELFLASGLNVNELSRKEKISALQSAVAAGHQDMVRLLIAYGADMEGVLDVFPVQLPLRFRSANRGCGTRYRRRIGRLVRIGGAVSKLGSVYASHA